MSIFAKAFPVDQITNDVLKDNPWFKDLLALWKPAGDLSDEISAREQNGAFNASKPNETPLHLRLAIRNKSINFYRGGASIGKIEWGPRAGLTSEIHHRFVLGNKAIGTEYLYLSRSGIRASRSTSFSLYNGKNQLEQWINNANNHAENETQRNEKIFVDKVISHNPNIIDVEMGLPRYQADDGNSNSANMDMVALEPVGNQWRIVFWEAKLVSNGEARCEGEGPTPVVAQLERYTKWLQHGNHRNSVLKAFKENCRILVAFHKIAEDIGVKIGPLGRGIVAAAAPDASPLLIDESPCLLIDNRTPNNSFEDNGHLARLRKRRIHVQMVNGNGPDDMILDLLPSP